MTAEQKAKYGQFPYKPSEVQLARFFHVEEKIEDEARLSPLVNKHINMLGHYTFTLAEDVTNGTLRPLNQSFELDEIP